MAEAGAEAGAWAGAEAEAGSRFRNKCREVQIDFSAIVVYKNLYSDRNVM